jgi:hypothetical protein
MIESNTSRLIEEAQYILDTNGLTLDLRMQAVTVLAILELRQTIEDSTADILSQLHKIAEDKSAS